MIFAAIPDVFKRKSRDSTLGICLPKREPARKHDDCGDERWGSKWDWSITRRHLGKSEYDKTQRNENTNRRAVSLLLAFLVYFYPGRTLVGCPLKQRAFFVYPKRCEVRPGHAEKRSDARCRAPRAFFPRRLKWSGRQDLNLRPLVPQTSALPSCATTRYSHRSCRRTAPPASRAAGAPIVFLERSVSSIPRPRRATPYPP